MVKRRKASRAESVHDIVLGEDGEELNDPQWADGPKARTWREVLIEKCGLGKLRGKARDELLEDHGLEESQLAEQVEFEALLDWYPEESPNGSLYFALEPLRKDRRAKALLEFVDWGSPGANYLGVRVIGSLFAINDLLREHGLPYRIASECLRDELDDEAETDDARDVLDAARARGDSPEAYRGLPALEKSLTKIDGGQQQAISTVDAEGASLLNELASARSQRLQLGDTLKSFNRTIDEWAELAVGPIERRVNSVIGWNTKLGHVRSYLQRHVARHGSLPTGSHDVGTTSQHNIHIGTIDFDEIARRASLKTDGVERPGAPDS